MSYASEMTKEQFIRDIEKIHEVALATVDEDGAPVVRIIDMMLIEDNCLLFLTARGKDFYKQISATGGYVTLACQIGYRAYHLKGYVKQMPHDYLLKLFDANTYMYETYPSTTRDILEVFKIYKWQAEYFDVNPCPIERVYFQNGYEDAVVKVMEVNDNCINCQSCAGVCSQGIITFDGKAQIPYKNCLKCGACAEICPVDAVSLVNKKITELD